MFRIFILNEMKKKKISFFVFRFVFLFCDLPDWSYQQILYCQKFMSDNVDTSSSPPHESNELACNCGKTFRKKSSKAYHQRWECGQVLMCKLCHRVLETVYGLRRHMVSHKLKAVKSTVIELTK